MNILSMRRVFKSDQQRSLWNLHIAIVLFGFTAVLGGLITLDAIPLVWWRLILAVISFIPLLLYRRLLDWRAFGQHKIPILLVGIFLAFHWVTFFLAVKLGNASIAVLCRSEEHTSELQSRGHLVCRLLLEKKKRINRRN